MIETQKKILKLNQILQYIPEYLDEKDLREKLKKIGIELGREFGFTSMTTE